jgi:hypothetical protein
VITFDVHSVHTIHARATSSECGRFGWVKLTFAGPKELVELTAYMPIESAEAYADAINNINGKPILQIRPDIVEHQRGAA